jgi:integrase
MPRRSKGAYKYLIKYKNGRPAQWVIRDGSKTRSTGLGADASIDEVDAALAKYVLGKHDPKPQRPDNPNEALVADCLSVYLEKKLAAYTPPESDKRAQGRQNEDRQMVKNLLEFFGLMTVGEVTGAAQKEYAAQRTTPNMARRELVILSAAINDYFADQGGFNMVFRAIVPDQPPRRERFLTRDEAAKLVWAAWRNRQTDRGGGEGRSVGKHNARHMLVGFYTGSRCGAICNAATMPTIGRSYIDYEAGVFYRQSQGGRLTNKSQNAKPSPIPPRLLVHMRRWKRLGISNHSVIEWNGKPVKNLYRGFMTAVRLAGLVTDNPRQKVMQHTMRHTAATWYLQGGVKLELVADYVGMSAATLKAHYRHHMQGHFEPVMKASYRFGRTDESSRKSVTAT